MPVLENRRRGFNATRERRTLAPVMAVWLAGMSVLWLVASGAPTQRVELLLDPAASGALPWYVGLVAKLAAVGWCVAAVAAFGAGQAARVGGRDRAASFFNSAGLLATLLLADDLFLLHSSVLDDVVPGPKVAVVAAYALAIAAWVLANLSEVARTRWRLLFAGGVGLFGSAVVDTLAKPNLDATAGLIVEDGLKFLGIITVALYFSLTATDVFRSLLHGVASAPDQETERGIVLADMY